VFKGDANWKKVKLVKGQTYQWDPASTYVKNPPFFAGMTVKPKPVDEVKGARVLAVFGDSITTDHISPAGNIKLTAPGGTYLTQHQVAQKDFNSYGSRRGNFELMERGTFANIRIRNEMMGGAEGGNTIYYSEPGAAGETMSIFDAAQRYKADGHPTVVIGGKEYGTGSSRDWAAKGPALQGVRAVITESFERIHRSNLVGMGVLPMQFLPGENRESLGLTGFEKYSITGIPQAVSTGTKARVWAKSDDGEKTFEVVVRIDTPQEVEYYRNGGILPYVVRQLAAKAKAV
jgi:aconitate hydratase